ncbi:MAG: retroviral-like aspartic protease family protein [Hormoscilla sp. GUM202]|nr:retroviral-like aspartic protease family protein [Hormoscilla sp. GM7CHS1pb]MBO1350693.1 retroviral-like aspartic protease family protein [Hormoscilla sp. GUM202]
MGEVKVKVKLTNAVDLGLVRQRRGPGAWTMPIGEVHSYEADALVDTGCISLVLPSHVVRKLGLERRGKQVARYADGRREEVDVTEAVEVEIAGRTVLQEALVLGDTVLIGQTILERMDLHVDCPGRRLLPNPEHPDQPVLRV